MGHGASKQQEDFLTEDEIEDYQDLTYFTRHEIIVAHKKFKALAPDIIAENRNARLEMTVMLNYPELRANPFGDRICKVFSSTQDGACSFEDFLDMMSVLSVHAPKTVKSEYAFRIFDFDDDDMIGREDLRELINRLTAPQRMTEMEMMHLIQNINNESDLDDDGMLSFAEFEHIISKCPDFTDSFSVKL
ncbi:calcium and integrin-binding protein 1-like [Pollicipes pollicipes]|uniref:calcium and integrin-binding protein 1-like n=1 Tax=Pollicipes pollicipes TaxID=41117 RepID=UPI0018850CB7|nr:calcium and integrin-binding protein 1-like [Pollicipes pollicipes]XP_037078325.1 calcium and integrin-binding protein 1-like [Pollicipes pollicipes]XP_037078326.1 calcium and integrin-binding protein 1-like [Pollicipes pollicipes]XP_037078327.1 calcium and integrin-binding protein 1-like [Pollicipes pollicipes]XP_037078328.1 calcium and integrin-binding protein 1-like [Pollicipes pollicipes]XP_037078525.1 calcium and integrin-binding protein 1-like [Pollicipes pollicipes]XP_037078526.1 ca